MGSKWLSNEKGNFELRVRGKFRGATTGTFKVTVDMIVAEKYTLLATTNLCTEVLPKSKT